MKSVLLRITFFACVSFSIVLIYYVNVVQKNYQVFTNPDGPDTTDYFINEDIYATDE
jgi:hypothetical protein